MTEINLNTHVAPSDRAQQRAKVTGKVFNYVRVSSKQQNEGRQLEAMTQFNEANGYTNTELLVDKETGTNTDRAELQYMLRSLRAGDLVVIKSIDRLSRNYKEVKELWRRITDTGADICVIDMPLLDTRQYKDLLGTFLSDLVLSVLGYVAEQETAFRKQRQAEGIKLAKERGAYKGRPKGARPAGFEVAYHKWQDNKDRAKNDPLLVTARSVQKELGLTPATFYRYVKDYEQELKELEQ